MSLSIVGATGFADPIQEPRLQSRAEDHVGDHLSPDSRWHVDMVEGQADDRVVRAVASEEADRQSARQIQSVDGWWAAMTAQRVGFFASYREGEAPPSTVRPAIERAVESYNAVLSASDFPVEVEVAWRDVSHVTDGLLAYAGPSALYLDFEVRADGSQERHLVTSAAKNQSLGGDYNPTSPEVLVVVNSNPAVADRFYLGSGTPGSDEVSLETVIVHEIGHGLGLLSNLRDYDKDGVVDYSYGHGSIDTILEFGDGTPLLDSAEGFAPSDLGGKPVFARISESQRMQMSNPSPWATGVNLAHVGSTDAAGSGSIFKPFIWPGRRYVVDSHAASLLESMGWESRLPVSPARTVSATASSGSVSVQWEVDLGSTRLLPDSWDVAVSSKSGSKRVNSSTIGASVSVGFDGPYSISVTGVRDGRVSVARSTQASAVASECLVADKSGFADRLDRDPASAQVFRLYSAFFLRPPGAAGLDYWSGLRRSGAGLRSIAWSFGASNEFENRYGQLSSQEFVKLVFRNVLCREANGTGLTYWAGRLDSGALKRQDMIVYFSEGEEFLRRTDTRHSALD